MKKLGILLFSLFTSSPVLATYSSQVVITDINTLSTASVTNANALKVDGSAVTQPVSGTFWQSVQPVSQSGSWSVLQSGTWNVGRTWTLSSGSDSVSSVQSGSWTVGVNNFPSTYAVTQSTSPWVISATSLPLPTGAATESTLSALNGKFTTTVNGLKVDGSAVTQPISGSVSVSNFPATQPISGTVTANQGTAGASAWKVDGSAVTQPISGTVTANAGTGTFTVGQATASNLNATVVQSSGTNLHVNVDSLPSISGSVTSNVTQFGSNNVVTGTGTSGLGIPRVTVSNDSNVLATQSGSWTVTANAGTNLNTSALALDTTVSGLQVSQGSTTSGQKGGLTLGAVTTAAPSYTTAQSSPFSLNTSGGLRVDGSGVTQPVSGTVTANAGTGTFQVNVTNSSIPVTQSGTWTTGRTWSLLNSTDSVNAVQSGTWNINNISGTVSLPTGAATAANQTTANTSLASIDSKLTAPLSVAQSGSWTVQQGTPPWSVSQSGTWTTGRTWTLSSGTDSVAAVQSGTWNINNIAGTISLPTGAATETTLAKLTQTQGSTTSGQSGPLVQGAVTTNSPSYTTAQTSPLSQTTRGAQRVLSMGGDTSTLIRNDYSSVNVTTAAYTQLVASTTTEINRLHIFDSSGQDLVLAVGGSGSEVNQIQIAPGGWDQPIELFIPSGSRISIKAVSATASSGTLLITGLK